MSQEDFYSSGTATIQVKLRNAGGSLVHVEQIEGITDVIDSRVDSDFDARTTDSLTEGTDNKYFTDERVKTAVSTDYATYTTDGALTVSASFYIESTLGSGTYTWDTLQTGQFGRIITRNGFSQDSQGITYVNAPTQGVETNTETKAILVEVSGELTESRLTGATSIHLLDGTATTEQILTAEETGVVSGQWLIINPTKVDFYGPEGNRFAYIEFTITAGENWYRADAVNNIFNMYLVDNVDIRLIHDNTDTLREGTDNKYFTDARQLLIRNRTLLTGGFLLTKGDVVGTRTPYTGSLIGETETTYWYDSEDKSWYDAEVDGNKLIGF